MLSAMFAVLIALLTGSFPSGVVLGRLVTGRDVRDFGSGNIGAANAARVGGFKVGAGVAVLDVLKGVLPVLFGKMLGLGPAELVIVALAAVLGHDFSIFLGFRGGKGVATTLGVTLALAPIGTIIAALLWLTVLLRSRYSSLASLLALAILPLAVALTGSPPAYVTLGFGLFVLAAIKHRGNIGRLMTGTESRFRNRRADGA
jgi:glycerol-3-phosphate acyltransferase PlsY